MQFPTLFQSGCFAALISQFMPFFTCHPNHLPSLKSDGDTYSKIGFILSCITSPGMKYRIAIDLYHASSVRPDVSRSLFTLTGRLFSPSLLLLCVRFRYLVWLGEEPTHTP